MDDKNIFLRLARGTSTLNFKVRRIRIKLLTTNSISETSDFPSLSFAFSQEIPPNHADEWKEKNKHFNYYFPHSLTFNFENWVSLQFEFFILCDKNKSLRSYVCLRPKTFHSINYFRSQFKTGIKVKVACNSSLHIVSLMLFNIVFQL